MVISRPHNMATTGLLLASVLAVLFVCAQSSVERVAVAVYYESLCPDSRRFFLRQLSPVFQQLDSSIDLRLVPFGNAHVHGKPDAYTFTCQHGREECYGNLVQTCFVFLTNDSAESIRFINCAFDVDTQEESITKCIASEALRDDVRRCVSREEGARLQFEMARATELLDPPQTFIPWITLDEEGSSVINRRANRDFLGSVCDRLSEPKPGACQQKKRKKTRTFHL